MQKTLKRYVLVFVLPTLVAFAFAFVIPFVMGVYLSFCKFTTVKNAKWVGLANYKAAFTQGQGFLSALGFTTAFTIVSLVTINVFAFALALLLTRKIRGTNIFRTIFFMPNLIGGIVLGYTWQKMINALLLRYETTVVSNAGYGFLGLVVLMNWQMIGYMMIIYIAGIQNVSEDVKEAAMIDGVTKIQMLRRIILPLIMPSITICMFMTITNSFKMFDLNLALTAGLPGKSTSMITLDIFNSFYNRMGYEGVGQAKAVVFFVILAVISVTQLMLTRKREVEN